MARTTVDDLFIHELSDVYSAEKQTLLLELAAFDQSAVQQRDDVTVSHRLVSLRDALDQDLANDHRSGTGISAAV